jgi:hypothetical protein
MRALLVALMVHDLHDPAANPPSHDGTHSEEFVDFGAVHGGDWRSAYNLRSTLASTDILGLPGGLRAPAALSRRRGTSSGAPRPQAGPIRSRQAGTSSRRST